MLSPLCGLFLYGAGTLKKVMIMRSKNYLILLVVFGLPSFAHAVIDMKTYLQSQGITPTGNTYTVDLKPYINAALSQDDVRFSGSGSVSSPLIYTSTAGIIVPEGAVSANRRMIIAPDAMIKRLPSTGWLITMYRFTKLYCDSINPGGNMANALKGRIDGNKAAHWPDFPEIGINDFAVAIYGSNCLVQKIHVFDNPGTAIKAYGYNNYSIIEYCKAVNCGYIDLKFGRNYYSANLDRYSADGFCTSYSGNVTVRNCESIDNQRWHLLAAEESLNSTFIDCTAKDINFRSFGFTDFEGSWGGNTLIRCHNLGGGPIGHGAQFYSSNYKIAGAPGDRLEDCNLAGTWIGATMKFPNASLHNVNTGSLVLGRYGADGDMTITGNFSLTDSVYIENGGFELKQDGGTITIDCNFMDQASYYPDEVNYPAYDVSQYNNGMTHIGGQLVLGYRIGTQTPITPITGNWTLNSSTLNFKGTKPIAKVVCGREGNGNIILSNSNITEDASKSIPMAIRWYESGAGSMSGNGTVGLTGWFVNNGKVIADGGTLDLSSFSSVNTNYSSDGSTAPKDIENSSDNGWYAINGGKLILPAVAVDSGSSSVNWGERQSDAVIDLINSVRVSFTDSSAGQLDIALLARDRSEARGLNTVGVWDVNFTGTFGSAQLQFRYDDADVARLGIDQSQLKVFKSTAGGWQDITASVDTFNHIITSSSVSEFSIFAVGKRPSYCGESGTYYLPYDLTGPNGIPDCYVDFFDFAAFAESWLCEGVNCYNIVDLTEFALEWLSCTDPENLSCI